MPSEQKAPADQAGASFTVPRGGGTPQPGPAPWVAVYTAESDWLAAMNRRLRLGPPKQMLPHTSGRRIRPISLPSRVHAVAPRSPTARPSLLEHQTLPLTSQRTPSGPHLTPSTMKSENRFPFESLL